MTEPNDPSAEPRAATTTRDRLLLAGFWTWACVLVLATLAQLFGWQGVLDLVDVKRWFAR